MKFLVDPTNDWDAKNEKLYAKITNAGFKIERYENNDDEEYYYVYISSLEELLRFREVCGCYIIVIDSEKLEIYNDYRE
jgi:hypothetical protein